MEIKTDLEQTFGNPLFTLKVINEWEMAYQAKL